MSFKVVSTGGLLILINVVNPLTPREYLAFLSTLVGRLEGRSVALEEVKPTTVQGVVFPAL